MTSIGISIELPRSLGTTRRRHQGTQYRDEGLGSLQVPLRLEPAANTTQGNHHVPEGWAKLLPGGMGLIHALMFSEKGSFLRSSPNPR